MKRSSLAALILAACFCLTIPGNAMRLPPKEVPPIVKDGIEYSAPLSRMGFVVATWTKTKQEIWSRQIYVIKEEYKLGLEGDVQDVFINEPRMDSGKLKIKNGSGSESELDPDSLNVKLVKGQAVIDFTNFKFAK